VACAPVGPQRGVGDLGTLPLLMLNLDTVCRTRPGGEAVTVGRLWGCCRPRWGGGCSDRFGTGEFGVSVTK
jgi:hypothetical protein